MAVLIAGVGAVEDGVLVPDLVGPAGIPPGVEHGRGRLALVGPFPAWCFPRPVLVLALLFPLVEDAVVVVNAHGDRLGVEGRGGVGVAVGDGDVHGEEDAAVDGAGFCVDVARAAGLEVQAVDRRAADDDGGGRVVRDGGMDGFVEGPVKRLLRVAAVEAGRGKAHRAASHRFWVDSVPAPSVAAFWLVLLGVAGPGVGALRYWHLVRVAVGGVRIAETRHMPQLLAGRGGITCRRRGELREGRRGRGDVGREGGGGECKTHLDLLEAWTRWTCGENYIETRDIKLIYLWQSIARKKSPFENPFSWEITCTKNTHPANAIIGWCVE